MTAADRHRFENIARRWRHPELADVVWCDRDVRFLVRLVRKLMRQK